MIYLKQNADNFNNDFRAMLQAFFPGEKIVLSKEDTRMTFEALFSFGEVELRLSDEDGYFACQKVVCDYENRKEARNPIKAGIYHLLRDYTKRTLPWGDMTGVRPTKIATELVEKGYGDEDILNYYTDTYFVQQQKADICLEVAKREHALMEGISFPDSYCLYIGIPFCPSTCLYCSFTSYPIAGYREKTGDYLEALFQEMEYAAWAYRKKRLLCVYIGGGTPTSLEAEQLEAIIQKVYECFDTTYLREFTVEAGRPDSITKEKLLALKENGVTRISINPQTMNQDTLNLIGRAHTVEMTKEAFHLARELGFDNINMDMIVGLPGETLKEISHTLEEIKKLAPDSLTVHSLAIKRAANLNIQMEKYRSMIKGSTNEMLLLVDDYAKEAGLKPYYLYRQKNIPGNLENIGYAKDGLACLYNILIMEEKMDIVALGAGASSKLVFHSENRIERIENVKNVEEYMKRIDEMIKRKKDMFEG